MFDIGVEQSVGIIEIPTLSGVEVEKGTTTTSTAPNAHIAARAISTRRTRSVWRISALFTLTTWARRKSRGRKRHAKPKRRLPPAETSGQLGSPEWSTLTPMGTVRGYGEFARGLRRAFSRRRGRNGNARSTVTVVVLVLGLLVIGAVAVVALG